MVPYCCHFKSEDKIIWTYFQPLLGHKVVAEKSEIGGVLNENSVLVKQVKKGKKNSVHKTPSHRADYPQTCSFQNMCDFEPDLR